MTISQLFERMRQNVQDLARRDALKDEDVILCFDPANDYEPFLISKADLFPKPEAKAEEPEEPVKKKPAAKKAPRKTAKKGK